MSSTVGPDTGPATVPSDWDRLRTIAPAPTPPREQVHGLQFTGSGSEYFRIWIVNLLLTLVTLGLYYPWAKVRKLRYFCGNTHLAGHAFDFHGDPKRMLRGYLLVGALFALYAFAGQVSPIAGLIALVIIAAIWPALLRASMRFRLAQTSWRGLRFAFIGDTAGAYKALLPGFAAVIAFIGLFALAAPDREADAAAALPFWAGALMLVGTLLFYAALPYTLWLLKRYQHDHYQYASVRTRFVAGPGSFYLLALKTAGLLLAAIVVFGATMALVAIGAASGRPGIGRMVFVAAIALAAYAALLFTLQPYLTSRLQNLVWSRTESRSIGFASALRLWPLVRLTAVNWMLVVLTLGLYWPFAAVATARMRLAAVSVTVRTDLDALVARGARTMDDAAGDAAADLFDIDIGL
jgi:uncharacterized membrane protein YjgN (DUF898 family)